MKKTLIPILTSLLASAAVAATTELNVAESTIESADGLFVGRDFHIVDGFKLEMIYHPDTTTEGQWVALGWDDQGRLIVPSYNSDKLMRLTIPAVGEPGEVRVEMIDEPKVGAAEGVLYAFDSLYLNVNRSNTMRAGLYRIFDTDGDDQWDTTRVIQNRQGDGSDHGTHTLQLSPDGNRIFMISGNATRMTEHDRSRTPEIWGEDNLVLRLQGNAPGFNRAPEAHIMSYNADGSDIELWSMGMRNPVSFAFNKDGEIFVYDADHEPDFGFISYRPTNVMHAISGADGGWRASSRFHPFYYFDDFGTIAVVGAGSPVPSTFGTGAKFPAEFQDAFYIGDWSFGRLYAVNITPSGSSYKADVRPFLEGRPFAVSGTTVNPADGSMIIQTTGTELYRVTYVGNEDTTPTQPDTRYRSERDLRHYLESFHGKQDSRAVDVVWPYLKDEDRAIRFAARTALEWQDPALWRDRAVNELNPRTTIAAIASLARVTGPDEYHYLDPQWGDKGLVRDAALQARMFAALDRIDWDYLGYQDKLDLLRAYSLVMIRLGRPNQATIDRLVARFDPYLPAVQKELNWELSEMLVYLQAPSAADKVMALLRNAPTAPYYGFQEWINPQQRQRQDFGDQTGPNIGVLEQDISRQMDQLHYVQLLRTLRTGWTPDLRREYLGWFLTEPQNFKGSMSLLTTVRADAIAMVPESERAQYQDLIEPTLAIGGGRGGFGAAANGTPGLGAPAASLWVPGGNGRPMTDVELTALTRFDETVESQLKAQTELKDALTAASFSTTSNAQSLQALVNRLGDAELALALARADNFDPVRVELNVDSPARLSTVIQAMESRGGRGFGGGGGGRGGAAGAAGGRGGAGAPAGQ